MTEVANLTWNFNDIYKLVALCAGTNICKSTPGGCSIFVIVAVTVSLRFARRSNDLSGSNRMAFSRAEVSLKS
jgi:hypothetical protein